VAKRSALAVIALLFLGASGATYAQETKLDTARIEEVTGHGCFHEATLAVLDVERPAAL
jgi:hypothetical protein